MFAMWMLHLCAANKLSVRYRPETKQEKKARLEAVAKATAEEKEAQAKVSS